MTDKSDLPKVIYLIPDGGGYVWCEDPAPGIDMKEKDAIKYLSAEAFIQQACEAVHTLFKDNGLQKDIYYTDIAQAIRDKFTLLD